MEDITEITDKIIQDHLIEEYGDGNIDYYEFEYSLVNKGKTWHYWGRELVSRMPNKSVYMYAKVRGKQLLINKLKLLGVVVEGRV